MEEAIEWVSFIDQQICKGKREHIGGSVYSKNATKVPNGISKDKTYQIDQLYSCYNQDIHPQNFEF